MHVKDMLKQVYHRLGDIKRTRQAVSDVKHGIDETSYFPELTRKTPAQIRKEKIAWAKKYGEKNRFYNLYGFDVEGLRDQEQYIDNYSFMETRNKANGMGNYWSYVALLRDKFLFYKYMKSNGILVPEVFAVCIGGKLHDPDMNEIGWDSIKSDTDYFVKSIDGECASFVRHIQNYEDLEKHRDEIRKTNVIFQRLIVQSSEMKAINPSAINTLRVITINKDGNPYVLSVVLRVGTTRSGSVDNWAAGGLSIGVESDGHLKQFGFYKPGFGTKADVHPDTGVRFSEFKVPQFSEAMELCLKAHRCIYGIKAIGWDVAISNDGPTLIEGNDNFEISLMQICDRPLRKEWMEACR